MNALLSWRYWLIYFPHFTMRVNNNLCPKKKFISIHWRHETIAKKSFPIEWFNRIFGFVFSSIPNWMQSVLICSVSFRQPIIVELRFSIPFRVHSQVKWPNSNDSNLGHIFNTFCWPNSVWIIYCDKSHSKLHSKYCKLIKKMNTKLEFVWNVFHAISLRFGYFTLI